MIVDDISVRAATDAHFRSALLSEPEDTLRSAGVPIPEGVQVRVVESTPDHLRIAIPPAVPEDVELNEEALAGAAGGITPTFLVLGAGIGAGFGIGKLIG